MRAWLARNRAALILAALLVAGGVLGQTVAERTSDREGPTLSSTDAHPNGALAMALWLERLGYRVERIDTGGSLADIGVLFVLLPVRPFARAEATALADWVRRGGVLVYHPGPSFSIATGDGSTGDALATELEIGVRFGPFAGTGEGTEAFFTAPQATTFRLDSRWALDLRGDDWVPLVQEDDRTYAAGRQLGEGRVVAVTADAFFSNARILDRDNPAFTLNILARAPGSRAVAFEEAHHRRVETPDLLAVMRVSPWGWAIGYACALTFGFIVWGGRRFGPPVVAAAVPARSSGEYISAFAGLLQRRRATDWLQKRYAAVVRQRVASRLGVRSDLPAAELGRLLAERQPIDRAAFAAGLSALDGSSLGERALLELVRSIEAMLRAGGR
jgi:hypothetical protein